jgi:hypothetical protein
VIEVYQVFVGGRSGAAARAATPVLDKVPAAQVGAVIEHLARAHAAGQDLVATGQALAATMGQGDGATAAERAA